jgi:hypothetical protein
MEEEFRNLETIAEEVLTDGGLAEDKKSETEAKRAELIGYVEDGNRLSKTVKKLDKASARVIDKVYKEYMTLCGEHQAGVVLCDVVISKFAHLLGGLDAIESPEELEKSHCYELMLRG